MQPSPASAQSLANRGAASSEQSAYSVVYSFRGEEDGSLPANLVRLEDGTVLGSSTGFWRSRALTTDRRGIGKSTIFQVVGDGVKTLERFELKNEMRIGGFYPWHDSAVLIRASWRGETGAYSGQCSFRFSLAEGFERLPEEWDKLGYIAPATRPSITYGIGSENGVFRFDESNGDLKLAQSHIIRDVGEGGDGHVYAIGKSRSGKKRQAQLL